MAPEANSNREPCCSAAFLRVFTITHVCLLLPMRVYCYPCVFTITHVCLLLPMCIYYYPCVFIVTHVCFLLPMCVMQKELFSYM